MKYIIDLDGTLMNGDRPNKDSVLFIDKLNKNGSDFIIMTNSMSSPKVISERLESVGISVDTSRIINPISAINSYIKRNDYETAFVVGSDDEIEQVNIKEDKENPSVIILLDFEKENLAFKDLQRIFELVQRGVQIITASKSPYYVEDNKQVLDTGAFVKLFEAAAHISIEVLGKPSIEYFMSGVNLLDAQPHEVTVIGDDWRTDILGANSIHCNAILIRSGKYRTGDELKCKILKCVDSFSEILDKS